MPTSLVEERFWEKVAVGESDDCWLWTASLKPNGYSQFNYNGKNRSGHRVAYELAVGPIPDGLTIDHLCRVRRCVNPCHLEVVTGRENQRRGFAARTHCPSGHEFTVENTLYSKPRGHRFCRTCYRTYQREYRRRQRRMQRELVHGNPIG